MSADASAAPRVAIVIPVYRQPVLVAEAIESALAQRADFPIRIVVVNDGCPLAETHAVCRDYAARYPDRVAALSKPNGGLSDARNFGIRHALGAHPGVEAVFMLDSDNRLRPDAMARGMAALDADPDAAWIYPNIDMFGLANASDYGGPYSPLLHAHGNICEAGSLIHRRVFEAGIFYDTSFKLGYEDWDFYLTAAEHGFRGRNLGAFGFRYRKRPESMLAESDRNRGVILAAMQLKHRALLRPSNLVALEHADCPRYACVLADENTVSVFTDPDAAQGGRTWSQRQCEAALWAAILAPGREHFPAFLLVTGADVVAALRRTGLLAWVLWRLERALEEHPRAALVLEDPEPGPVSTTIEHGAGDIPADAALIMVRRDRVERDLLFGEDRPSEDVGVDAVSDSSILRLGLPPYAAQDDDAPRATARHDLPGFLARCALSPFRRAADHRWDWRKSGIGFRARAHEISRSQCHGAPTFPRVGSGAANVALIVDPALGAVAHKPALAMAEAIRGAGGVPHAVFVSNAVDGALFEAWQAVAETVGFFDPASERADEIRVRSFFGEATPLYPRETAGLACGLLHWLDGLVLFDQGKMLPLVGEVRRLGKWIALPLDVRGYSDPVIGMGIGDGASMESVAVAYEHAIDCLVVGSDCERSWLHRRGVPLEKIDVAPPNEAGVPERLRTLLCQRA